MTLNHSNKSPSIPLFQRGKSTRFHRHCIYQGYGEVAREPQIHSSGHSGLASAQRLWQSGCVSELVGRLGRGGTRWVEYRGRVLKRRDLERLQRLIDRAPPRSRQEIAEQVCRQYGWRQPNGQWAVSGCRLLLARLHRRGWLVLPASRRTAASAPRPRRAAGAVAPSPPLSGVLPGALVVRPVHAAERRQCQADLEHYHYLGACALIAESLSYVALIGERRVGWVSWAAAALHNPPRDRYLGWDAATKARQLPWVVNNVRFVLLPGAEGRQLASRILAANLRRLSADWRRVHGHHVLLAETFVDTSRFAGTCYRASNWQYLGQTRGFGRRAGGYVAHGQPKAVFVYPLHRRARQWLRTPRQERASGHGEEGRMELRIEALPVDGAGGLIEELRQVVDPRKRRGVRHSVVSVVTIAVCAVLCGARSIAAIAQWAAELDYETLWRLGCRRRRPPSERTLRRVLGAIDVGALDARFGQWMAGDASLNGQALALDGKTLRGSRDGSRPPVHLLSALLHQDGVVVAQQAVADKTNEIPMVQPLLAPLAMAGAVVTADALLTQKEIARYVVEDKHADYVFTVKDNQPTLRRDIQHLGLEAFPPSAPLRR